MGGYLCVLLSLFEAGLFVCDIRPSTKTGDVYVLVIPFVQICAI